MKEVKLSTQFNLIFTIVTVLTSALFIFALNHVFEDFRKEQNQEQLQSYFNDVIAHSDAPPHNDFNGYIIYQNGVAKAHNMDVLEGNYTVTKIIDTFRVWPGHYKVERVGGQNYYFYVASHDETLIVVFTGETYLQHIGNSFTMLMQLSFVALVLFGNVIILIWSRITVDRVKRLQGEVSNLSMNHYKTPIKIDGSDEITHLAKTVEHMRQEIIASEKTKQEMLQNVSHDFKTPISVIQSYAEAIADGVSDPTEANVIIKQADLLNQKVRQLLELSKLEYLKSQDEFEVVNVKEIIVNIINNYKYRSQIEIVTDLDKSTYFGITENFYTAFNNIIDNALRYAKTKIVIQLKNKKLTFYNDGESIDQKFIDQLFKPYEKGQQGQFGLGMSIVQKTLTHFNLNLKVENVDQGVRFTIEPL
jgi:two-component system, OmpR family, sensor histidine kinase CssS